MHIKEFEVRARHSGLPNLYRVVRSTSADKVLAYFQELCWFDIYVQEVPFTSVATMEII